MADKAKTLLIDGDLILFRSCAAVEREVCWDGENYTLHSSGSEAWIAVEDALNKLFKRFDTDKHVIALTSSPTFRHALCSTYKANRAGQRKPLAYKDTMARLIEEYTVKQFAGLEADDILGIFATRAPDDTIVCSADKDMRSIPCVLFAGEAVVTVSEAEADYNHLMQTLTGDTADGYPGCPKIGPVKAKAILTFAPGEDAVECSAWMWEQVVAAFEKAGLTEDDALLQARLARILRTEDWDATKKEPILWTP